MWAHKREQSSSQRRTHTRATHATDAAITATRVNALGERSRCVDEQILWKNVHVYTYVGVITMKNFAKLNSSVRIGDLEKPINPSDSDLQT